MATKPTILIIDNDPLHLDLARAFLNEDFEVITHVNGYGVLDRITALQPALVLIDIRMPGLSGVRLAALIRADVNTSHIPIVFYSSDDEQRLVEIISTCDIQGHICKSDITNLRKKIRHFIEVSTGDPLALTK